MRLHTCSSEVSSRTFYCCLTPVSFFPGPVLAILLNSEYLIHVINQTQKRLYIFQRYPLYLVILVFSLTLSYGHRLQTNSSTRLPASWASAGRVPGGLRCWAVVNLSWASFWSSAVMWWHLKYALFLFPSSPSRKAFVVKTKCCPASETSQQENEKPQPGHQKLNAILNALLEAQQWWGLEENP